MGGMGCVTVCQASVCRSADLSSSVEPRIVEAMVTEFVVVVRLEAASGRATLLLDPEWVGLALEAKAIDPSLIEAMTVPQGAVVGFFDGWV